MLDILVRFYLQQLTIFMVHSHTHVKSAPLLWVTEAKATPAEQFLFPYLYGTIVSQDLQFTVPNFC